MRKNTAGCFAGTVWFDICIIRTAAVGNGRFRGTSIGHGYLSVSHHRRSCATGGTRCQMMVPIEMRRRLAGLICGGNVSGRDYLLHWSLVGCRGGTTASSIRILKRCHNISVGRKQRTRVGDRVKSIVIAVAVVGVYLVHLVDIAVVW